MTNSKRSILILIIAILLFLILIVGDNLFGDNDDPIASHGVIDLSHISFDVPVYLNGEWKLYFGQLLEPHDFYEGITTTLSPEYRSVPDRWGQFLSPKPAKPYYGTGYGTYHLMIYVGDDTPELALYPQSMSTAYRLYINGDLVATTGTIGTSVATSVPQLKPTIIPVEPVDGHIELLIQVSNFHYAGGGIWAPIRLGEYKQMSRWYVLELLYSGMVSTALLVIGFFSFLLPLLSSSRLKPFIALPITSVLSVFIISTTGPMLFFTLFPTLSFRIGVMCLYIALIWLPVTSFISIKRLFGSSLCPYAYALIITASILTIPVLFAPLEVFTYFAVVYNIMGVPAMIGILFLVIRELKKGKWESYYLLFSLLVIAPSVFLSTLYHSCLLKALHFDALPIGFLTFIIIQAVIITSRYERMHRETKEALALANDREIARLNAQIRPHFLYNALNSIILQCYKNPQKAASLLENLSVYLRNRFRFSEERQFISLDEELDGIKAYLAIESARFHRSIHISIENDIDECLKVPALILQPLVENALLHGIEDQGDGKINIKTAKSEYSYRITVLDNGKGMSKAKIEAVLSGQDIGALCNINQRLMILYNRPLKIESSSLGTCFTIDIPINQ